MNEKQAYKTFDEYLQSDNIKKGGRYLKGNEYSTDIPLVTILTICRNASATIGKTIKAVADQSYRNIEYLIIDGDSTDESIDIFKENEDVIDFWVSELDESATDAINKGITISHGEFVFFLNADDFVKSDFITNAVNGFDQNCDFVFGDCLYGNFGGEYNQLKKGDKNYKRTIAYTMPMINQPTIVVRKKCFDIVGLYDVEKKIAPDYDWLVRAYVNNINGKYLDTLVTFFALDGNSDKNYFKGLREVRESSLKYAGSIFFTNFYFLARATRRILKKVLI